MSINDQKRKSAPGNVLATPAIRMQDQAPMIRWHRNLHMITGEMASAWLQSQQSKETLTRWSNDLRAIAKEMQIEAGRAPL